MVSNQDASLKSFGQMAKGCNLFAEGLGMPGSMFWRVLGPYFDSWLRKYYISDLEVANSFVQFWNASEQLNCGVHIACVAHIYKSISLRNFCGFLNIHCIFAFNFTGLLELFSCFSSHYYEGASLRKGKQRLVVLSILFHTFIILALKRTFRFFGGMSVTAKTLAWKSS